MHVPRPLPNCSDVLREARKRSGFTENDIIERLGISGAYYMDLEYGDESLYMVAELNEIVRLASILSISPIDLLAIEVPREGSKEKITYNEVTELIKRKLSLTGESAENFENRVGWGIASILEDSEQIGKLSVDSLYDICEDLGIPWWKVIPD